MVQARSADFKRFFSEPIRRAFFAALCALAVPFGAGPQQAVRHRFVSENPDSRLEEILYLAMGVELAGSGYSSSKAAAGATHTLTTRYERKGEAAELRLELYDAKTPGAPLATVDARLPLDLSIDSAIADAVRLLLSRARTGPAAAAEGPSVISDVFTSPLVSLRSTLRTQKRVRPETAAATGATLFVGDFAEYAGFGATAALQAGALFLRKDDSFSLGPRFSVTRAFSNSGVSGGALYLTSAALNLQYGLGAAQRYRLAGCLAGGAAVLTVTDGGSVLSKMVPYADAGLQAGFPLGKDFFLGGEVRYQTAFDRDIIIMGAAAALSVSKEF